MYRITSYNVCYTKLLRETEAKTIAELEQEIAALKQKQSEYNSIINSLGSDISQQQKEQDAIENQINTTQSLMEQLTLKMSALETEIANTQAQISGQESKIEAGVEDFKLRLRAMYISGNSSVASVLLGSSDFFDMLMKLELIERVAEHDNKVITDLITLKNQYEEAKATLENDMASLEASKTDYQANLDSLNALYNQSEAMIAQKEAQKKQYENMTAEQKKAEEEAEKEIQRIIEEEARKNNAVFNGTFLWPVPNYKYISSYYGPRGSSYHYGIDISGWNIYGKPITASATGRVIIAVNNYTPGYSYGKYVVIDHGSGYSTVYGHCSSLAVSVGDVVLAGQVIAYIGSTGNSTGPHLHFEVRENGVRMNPLNYVK